MNTIHAINNRLLHFIVKHQKFFSLLNSYTNGCQWECIYMDMMTCFSLKYFLWKKKCMRILLQLQPKLCWRDPQSEAKISQTFRVLSLNPLIKHWICLNIFFLILDLMYIWKFWYDHVIDTNKKSLSPGPLTEKVQKVCIYLLNVHNFPREK